MKCEVWKKERRFHQLNSRADDTEAFAIAVFELAAAAADEAAQAALPALLARNDANLASRLGRRGSGNACVTRRGGLLIMSGRHCHGNFAGSAHSLARSLQPQSPAADRHDHLVDVPLRTRARAAYRNRRLPPLFLAGGVSGRGARFGYIAVKVHRLERRASRQLYYPMRARSPCRRELASP